MTDTDALVLDAAMTPALILAGWKAAGRRMQRAGARLRWALVGGLAGLAGVIAAVSGGGYDGFMNHLLVLLAGALVGVGGFVLENRTLARRAAERLIARQVSGVRVHLRLDPRGWEAATPSARQWLAWAAVEALADADEGLVLVYGAQGLCIPDAALPQGLDRAGLRARIEGWRGAAA